jgi:hypothetical protein
VHGGRVLVRGSAVKTKQNPGRCTLCEGSRIPLVQSGVWICTNCDGWPPILEPPSPKK